MKVQEVIQLTKPNLSGTTRPVAGDQSVRTAVAVEVPSGIVGRREPDPNGGVTGELPPALDSSPENRRQKEFNNRS
jgi:hypothetical protein